MHLLVINQYYPPDEAPTGLMLEAVAEQLVAEGHEVTVLCSAGGYAGGGKDAEKLKTEKLKGVRVVRVGATSFGRSSFVGKLIDYLSFYGGVAWKLLSLRPAPDRVVALTTPPFLSLLARVGSWFRGGDHAHWVMDLYPDVMVAHGILAEGSIGQRLLGFLARLGFDGQRCAAVVTLGPDMAERIVPYCRSGVRPEWVPLWATGGELGEEAGEQNPATKEGVLEPNGGRQRGLADLEAAGRELRRERGWKDDELILMYSGNMGLGHRFGEFLALAERLKAGTTEGLKGRLVFYGRGKRRAEIEQFMGEHPDAPVELHEYVPREQLTAHLRSADLHLASLEPSWDGTMVPSKLQGIFSASRPVLFIGSDSSSIGRWVQESGGGWVVRPGDEGELDLALSEAGSPAQLELRGAAGGGFAAREFNLKTNASRVADLITG